MSRLRRELQELELIAEEQDRPADRTMVMDALAERTESHDSIRQILNSSSLTPSPLHPSAALLQARRRDRLCRTTLRALPVGVYYPRRSGAPCNT